MKKVVTLLMAIILSVLLMCSCSILDIINEKILGKGSESESTNIIVPEESDDVANVINICMYDFDTFNPLLTVSQSVKDAMRFVYEPLFTTNENAEIVNVLASGYEISNDGKSVKITLKDGVQWHDGSQFSAHDVLYTISSIVNGKTTYESAMSEIVSFTALDNMTVQINLKHGLPNVMSLFTFPVIKNNTSMESNPSYVPIGTGPFSYCGKIGVERYMLLASDYYHNGKAQVGGIYIDTVPDNKKYFTMFNSGNIDVANGNLIRGYEYTPKANMQANEYITDELMYIGINNASPYLTGKNTRQAINCFIDRAELEDSIMYSSIVSVDTPINPSSEYYCGNTATKDDSVRGIELIEADGWTAQTKGFTKKIRGQTHRLKLSLLVNEADSDCVKLSSGIESCLNMNGIEVVLEKVPYDVYNARIEAGNYDLFVGVNQMSSTLDVTDFLGSGYNKFNYNNITIDMLMNQMGTVREKEDLKALFIQLRDVLYDDMPIVPIGYKKGKIYTSARIKGISPWSINGYYRDLQNWSIK